MPRAPGLVLLTPDRVSALDQWWRQPSTATDRLQFRVSLGWRYDAAVRYVTRILSERPNLRAAAAADEGAATDLAAVHVFAASDHADELDALRAGSVDPARRAFLSCMLAGLRRLPTLTGVVLRGGPDDPVPTGAYPVARDVVETGLLLAVADPDAELPGSVEVLIWSSTARRLDGLAPGSESAPVVFLPGTVFRILDVDRTGDAARVMLSEIPPSWAGRVDAERDRKILDRLRVAAQGRAGDGGREGRQWTDRGLVALPGLVPASALRGAA
jgi:hypothetical protein